WRKRDVVLEDFDTGNASSGGVQHVYTRAAVVGDERALDVHIAARGRLTNLHTVACASRDHALADGAERTVHEVDTDIALGHNNVRDDGVNLVGSAEGVCTNS